MEKGTFVPVASEGSMGMSFLFPPHKFQVQATGEFREPKKGEWFISGAIPEGYKTRHDLSVNYHIGKLFEVKKEVITTYTIIKEAE